MHNILYQSEKIVITALKENYKVINHIKAEILDNLSRKAKKISRV